MTEILSRNQARKRFALPSAVPAVRTEPFFALALLGALAALPFGADSARPAGDAVIRGPAGAAPRVPKALAGR